MDTRPEEWEFINMRVTLILRILQFSFTNISSALNFCIYFAFIISFFMKKGDTSSLGPGL